MRSSVLIPERPASVIWRERSAGSCGRQPAPSSKDRRSWRFVRKIWKSFWAWRRIPRKEKATKPQVGIVRGLAWTSVGGDTLSIEVNVMPGKGKLALTGRMGDVMKESAQIGLSYIRSIARQYDIDGEFFEKHDYSYPYS